MELSLLSSPHHLATMTQAMTSLVQQGNTLGVTSREGATLCLSQDLLLLHSPFLRALLASLPPLTSPRLLLPHTSLSSLLALDSLLQQGSCTSGQEAGQVQEAARLLGINMQSLELAGQELGRNRKLQQPARKDIGLDPSAGATFTASITNGANTCDAKVSSPYTNAKDEKAAKTSSDLKNKTKTPDNSSLKEVIKPTEEATEGSVGVVSVEVYGEDDDDKTVVKTEPLEAEINLFSTDNSESPEEPQKEVGSVEPSAKRKESLAEEENEAQAKKMKLLDVALDNLRAPKSPPKVVKEAHSEIATGPQDDSKICPRKAIATPETLPEVAPKKWKAASKEAPKTPKSTVKKDPKTATSVPKEAAAAMLRVMTAGRSKSKETKKNMETEAILLHTAPAASPISSLTPLHATPAILVAPVPAANFFTAPGPAAPSPAAIGPATSSPAIPAPEVSSPAPPAPSAPSPAPPAPAPPGPAPISPAARSPATPAPAAALAVGNSVVLGSVTITPRTPTTSPKTAKANSSDPNKLTPRTEALEESSPSPNIFSSKNEPAKSTAKAVRPKETATTTASQSETESVRSKVPRQALKVALAPQARAQARDSDCNYTLTCELCQNEFKTLTQLYNHVASHLKNDLEKKHKDLMDGFKCRVCGQMFKAKSPLLVHIACKHGKINDILKEKSYKVLPCPINIPSTSETQSNLEANMQANLLIKKERLEDQTESMEPL